MHHCQICGVVFDIQLSKIGGGSSSSGSRGSPYSNGTSSSGEKDGRDGERDAKRPRPNPTLKKYDGSELRAVEAEGINEMQCVLLKVFAPGPAPHDLHCYEFEKNSKTILTGVCAPNPEAGHEHGHAYSTSHFFVPPRYGVVTCDSSNVTAPGMPVHKDCFEIFKKVSLRKFGRVDMDGLYFLRNKQSDSNGFMNLDRGEDVKKCRQKDHWEHHEGTEYLAANPIKVRNLENVLSNCPFAYSNYTFEPLGPVPPLKPSDTSNDPFVRLQSARDDKGGEIGQRIIDNIISFIPDKKSVAHVRQASRAFGKLPQLYFKRVFAEEYSSCFFEMFDEKGKITRMPTDWGVKSSNGDESGSAANSQTIDWRGFYKQVKELKGMRNRKRIWKDTLTICDRIKKMHAKEANKAGRSSYHYTASYTTPTKYFDAGSTDRRRFSVSFS